jgi:hypothetical protein
LIVGKFRVREFRYHTAVWEGEQRLPGRAPTLGLQRVLTIAGRFRIPLGLAVIGIGWYGTAHTGYVFEQVSYLASGGLFGLGLTISGALIFFSSWLARLIQLQREQAELTRRLLDRTPTPGPSSTQLIPVAG